MHARLGTLRNENAEKVPLVVVVAADASLRAGVLHTAASVHWRAEHELAAAEPGVGHLELLGRPHAELGASGVRTEGEAAERVLRELDCDPQPFHCGGEARRGNTERENPVRGHRRNKSCGGLRGWR